MVDDFQPSRQKADLAEVVEMLLDKGVVLNADIAVSVGDTQLLGIQVRAALASFETAAKYGLEFPEGTDMRRVAEAAGEPELAEEYAGRRPPVDPTRGVNVTAEEGDYGRKEETSEGGGESEDGSNETDSDAETADDTGDRGSERLGARPDPDQPNSGDIDVFDDGPLDIGEDDDSESASDDQNQDQEQDENDEETATTETEGANQ